MSIFAKPSEKNEPTINSDISVLFLHGLEGSPDGEKSKNLNQGWGAKTPPLRSAPLQSLRTKYPGREWQQMPTQELNKALDFVYEDALAALFYQKPDIVIGSSMGGALLARLILEKKWDGPSVFLAPAIQPLLGSIALPQMNNAVWILGELDDIVPNNDNIKYCKFTGGNLMISMKDSHRLHLALASGLIDNAIITALSLV
jgi:predicted alpha/beta-fold hydrolase